MIVDTIGCKVELKNLILVTWDKSFDDDEMEEWKDFLLLLFGILIFWLFCFILHINTNKGIAILSWPIAIASLAGYMICSAFSATWVG